MTRPPSLPRPGGDASEHAPFYGRYVALVADRPLRDVLAAQPDALARLLDGADPAAAYAPGKWTISQVVQHIADTERVFTTRLLCAARGDAGPLPGFDENAWAEATPPDRPLDGLLAEIRAVRAATLALAGSLDEAAWDRATVASGHRMTARAAAWIIAGHTQHHARVLAERYGLTEG